MDYLILALYIIFSLAGLVSLIFGLPGYPEWVKRPHARGLRDE